LFAESVQRGRLATDNFIAAIENAFHYFGGVAKSLVIDNLKAAVKNADWYDPEIHPKLQSFAAHYGTVFLPTKPYTPEHKGKVESGVKYAKNNALAGHVFASLSEQNAHLLEWEEHVPDTRIHGTTSYGTASQSSDYWTSIVGGLSTIGSGVMLLGTSAGNLIG
jgi:transposase